MGAIKDPRVTVVFEWDTGTKKKRKTHVVRLEIPPNAIAIRGQKNVQQALTTRGYVHNHGPEKLRVINCSGVAYHPANAVQEGFNPNAAFSGLEYLNSAYVASGRLSSSTELTNTISSKLLAQTAIQNAQAANSTNTTQTISTIQQRQSILNKLSEKVSAATTRIVSYTQTHVDTLKNVFGSSAYAQGLSETEKTAVLSAVGSLSTSNIDATLLNLSALSNPTAAMESLVEKYDYYVNKFKSESLSTGLSSLDPSIFNLIAQDPFVLIKSLAAQSIVSTLRSQFLNLRANLKGNVTTGADDWVVTIYMYWQDQVFAGHFESFNMNQNANNLNLWNWDFTFVAHQCWVLKRNNVIPYDRAFDPALTENPALLQYQSYKVREGVDLLDRLLAFGGF